MYKVGKTMAWIKNIFSNMSRKNLAILITGTIVFLISIIFVISYYSLKNTKYDVFEHNYLGDIQYECSEWVPGEWSTEWKSGSPSASLGGQTVAPSNDECTSQTYYTQVEVDASTNCLTLYGLSSVPCYRERVWRRSSTIAKCDEGYFIQDGSCEVCPVGYSCDGVNKTACTGSTYQDREGQSSCITCQGTVNSDHTSCTYTPCSVGYFMGQNGCEACPAGSYCDNGTSKTTCPSGTTSDVGATSESDCYKTNVTSCDMGQYLSGGICYQCPIGYYCQGVDKIACSGSSYQDQTGQASCKFCSGWTNSSNTSCFTDTCDSGYYQGENGCTVCPAGYSCDGTSKTACSGANQYQDQTGQSSCKTCPYIVNEDHTSCTQPPCSAGYYMGENTCEKCPGGYYCADGSTKEECPAGTTSNMGATSADDCYEIADVSQCSVSVSIDSSNVSIDEDNISNSYYPVKVTVSGNGCNGQHLDYSATNASSLSKTSESNISSGAVYYFNVYPAQACTSSTATATLRESGKSASATVSTILTDWVTENGCWTSEQVSGKPIGFLEADRLGENEYYDDYGSCPSGGYGYTTHAYRYGCGVSAPTMSCYVNQATGDYKWATISPGSGYTIDSSKTTESSCKAPVVTPTYSCYVNSTTGDYKWATTSPGSGYTIDSSKTTESSCKAPVVTPTYSCYVNSTTGDYKWATTSPGSGYTIDSSKTTESSCKAPVVTPTYSCYVNSTTGEYKWATTSPGSGYTIDSSITTESSCKAPVVTPTYSCYVNSTTGDYKWATTSPGSGYTLDSSKTTESSCKAPGVTPTYSCYVNSTTGDYKWATTSPGSGYTIDSSITTESSCKAPIIEAPACYKDKDDNYVWGKYQNDNNYTLIDDILNEDDCKETIDVPITSRNVMNIIYVFVIILLASGIYVIYYSYMKKKNNK